MIGIIPCGSAKRSTASPAAMLYTGTFFKAVAAYARSLLPADRILILSAKHGLVRPTQWLEPYNLRMGEPGCVDADTVRRQAAALGLAGPALVIAGQDYARVARAALPEVHDLLAAARPQMRGPKMGHTMQWLNTNRGRLPDALVHLSLIDAA